MITIRKRTIYIWVAILILLIILSPGCYLLTRFVVQGEPNRTPLPAYPGSSVVQAEKNFEASQKLSCYSDVVSTSYQAYDTDALPNLIINFYRSEAKELTKVDFGEYTGTADFGAGQNKRLDCFFDMRGREATFKALAIFDKDDPQDAAFIQKYFAKANGGRYLILLLNGGWAGE